jgi:hypothetical protein
MEAAQGAVRPNRFTRYGHGFNAYVVERAAWGRPAGERCKRDMEANRRLDAQVSHGFAAYIRDGIVVGPLGEEARHGDG